MSSWHQAIYNHNVDLSSAFHRGYLLWCLPGKHGDVAHNHVRCIHARTGSQLVIRNGKIITLTTLSSVQGCRSDCPDDNKVASATNVLPAHYRDVMMGEMASQITSITIVLLNRLFSADQRKHQSSASLAFVREIHRWPVNSPHKWPVTQKRYPFDDVIMICPVRDLFKYGKASPTCTEYLHKKCYCEGD